MWCTRHFFLLWCLCAISITIAQVKLEEEKDNGTTTLVNPSVQKTEAKPEAITEDRKTLIRKYRRPHIERVWIMRPFSDNRTNGNNRFNINFSEPIRSFASAIKDPETFVRYLRQEEKQELAKYARHNLTFHNKSLPNSRYIQMEIFSESEGENKIPVLNVIVEQDEYDKMDSRTFLDLMKEVASIPWVSNFSTEEINDGELTRQRQQLSTEQLQRNESVTSQNSQKLSQQYHNYNVNREIDGRNDKNQKDVILQTSSETQKNRSEQRRRKIRKRQRERQFRQRVSAAEPLIILGEFGQRTRNHSKSPVEFNRSKSHDILMAPSVYLLPPAESNFRHFNLPQNVLSFTQTPVPVPRERNSLRRRRKRPRPLHVEPSANEIVTETSQISTDSNRVYSDISQQAQETPITTDASRTSTDAYYHSMEFSTPEIHVPQVQVEVPRIHPSTTHSNTLNSLSTTSQPSVYSDFIVVHHQTPKLGIRSGETSSYSNIPEVDNSPSSIERGTNIQENLRNSETASSHSYDISEPDLSYIESRRILPPLADLSPPVFQTLNEGQVSYNEERNIPYSQNQESQSDFLITGPPNVNGFPNEEPAKSPGRINTIKESDLSLTHNVSKTIQQNNFDSLPQHVKNNYSSLKAVIEDMLRGRNNGFRAKENSSNERKQQQNQSRRRSKGHINREEEEYDELQLTAAETAYFRRRQLTQLPYNILENTEETGSIPGVPGRDYPIYNRPPKTNFVCIRGQAGYFVDVSTRCQVFFVCSEDGRGEPMMCPNGTLFNQDYLVCDWWYNVACEGAT